MRPSSRDDLRSTHPQKRSQAAQEAHVCPAVGRGTRRGRRWCDRRRDPAGGPARHRRRREHIAIALAQPVQCGTVALAIAEQAAVALAIAE